MSQPAFLWEPFEIQAGRTSDYQFKLYKPNKKAAAISGADVVRFKLTLKADDDDPLLDIRSGATLAGGSTITVNVLGVEDTTPAEITVRFAQADTVDLDWMKDHHGELSLVDDSETVPPDAIKRVAHGPVTVQASPGGNITLAP